MVVGGGGDRHARANVTPETLENYKHVICENFFTMKKVSSSILSKGEKLPLWLLLLEEI